MAGIAGGESFECNSEDERSQDSSDQGEVDLKKAISKAKNQRLRAKKKAAKAANVDAQAAAANAAPAEAEQPAPILKKASKAPTQDEDVD